MLQDAVHQDPGFARAYADLGDNLVSEGRRQEGYAAYRNALSPQAAQRLSRKERDFILGSYASDTRDFEAALAAFRDYSAYYDNDFRAWFYQEYPLDMLNRPQEAIQALQRASAIQHTGFDAQIAYNFLELGDYTTANTWILKDLRENGKSDHNLLLQGFADFLENHFSEALDAFIHAEASPDRSTRTLGYSMHTRLLAEQGRYDEALKVTDAAAAAQPSADSADNRGLLQLDRAYLEYRLGNYPLCFSAIASALELNKTPDAISLASTIAGIAIAHAPGAEADKGRAALNEMKASLPATNPGNVVLVDTLTRDLVDGEILLAENNPQAALIAFRRASALDAPAHGREYMGRALLAAAAIAESPATAASLREEALNTYAQAALHPGVIWRDAWSYPPGYLADQMLSYVALASTLHGNDPADVPVKSFLQQLRPSVQSQASH